MTRAFCIITWLLLICLPAAQAQNSPIMPIANANWTATDDLGRTLPTYAQVGPPAPNRWVGIFYFQWHGADRWGPDYDVTKFLKTHPGFKEFEAFPAGGPPHPTWYWAEPLFGYYTSVDRWVIRKHIIMLADAGIDFIFIDYTNGHAYLPELTAYLEVAHELKAQGVAVPKVVPFINVVPGTTLEALYTALYKPGKYDDLWFLWQGKPLAMCPLLTEADKLNNPALLAEMQNYFTFRPAWANIDRTKDKTKWQFLGKADNPALGPDGKPEQIVVIKSAGGPINTNMTGGSVSAYPGHVPTYNDQWLSPDSAQGAHFQYEWNMALKSPAPILCVTGWNEWIASVWETPGVPFLGRVTQKGQGHIVDEFNQEFNRDTEPMKGGYGDDYYYQLVANVRRYKGMLPPPAPSAPRTIKLDGPRSQWESVRPLFWDAKGDTANRDAAGATPGAHYVNMSARNDIVLAQVARDAKILYFHVRTASALSPATGKSWMLLFINTDANGKTGWNGYDFVVNRSHDGKTCSVEQCVGNAWQWKKIADVPMHIAGQDLVIAVPRRTLGLAQGKSLALDFKWADNIPDHPSVMDFYTEGDAAPDARFNYRFTEDAQRR